MTTRNEQSVETQEQAFLSKAADGYFERNYSPDNEHEKLKDDRIIRLHESLPLAPPKRMLEIGCLTGFRCELFRQKFGTKAYGVDPSGNAIEHGQRLYPDIQLDVGVVTQMPQYSEPFDCVVLGNFLYWVDRQSLFNAAAAIDAVLADKGILYLVDFDMAYPHKQIYHHQNGIHTYKMPHFKMFDWHPHYYIVHQTYYLDSDHTFELPRHDCTQITVLRKDCDQGFAQAPEKEG
nr:class I SAM-dependent methyltransferase [uncultured Pseudodesulfovibrio sp.]